jgi:lipid A 3-O-deacylase
MSMSDLAFITDGTFAVLTLVAGLIDMGVNHCPYNGCLATNEVQSYASLSAGQTVFQDDQVGEEIYFRRDTSVASGPFQWIYGFSAATDGELWGGIGSAYTLSDSRSGMFVQIHTMAGLYAPGSGVDLGGPIEFRSGLEVGYQTPKGIRLGLSVDHRSNAGIYSSNPGLETVQFRVSIPTN